MRDSDWFVSKRLGEARQALLRARASAEEVSNVLMGDRLRLPEVLDPGIRFYFRQCHVLRISANLPAPPLQTEFSFLTI